MINWRSLVWNMLQSLPDEVAFLSADSIYGPGSLKETPATKPFVMFILRERSSALNPGVAHWQDVEIHVHDEPGSYVRIDQTIDAIHGIFPCDDSGFFPWPQVNPVTTLAWDGALGAAHAIGARFQGDSADSADDYYGTITRYASYRLVGSGQ